MSAAVADIIRIMESIAPPQLSESWDNSGLQIGHKEWPVRKIVIALDPLGDVVNYSCSEDADMLITHHPLFFKPIKMIDFSTPVGKIIQKAYEGKLSIYSAHTNYDSALEGLNDILADKIGLGDVRVLGKPMEPAQCKLVFYSPIEHKEQILKALFKTTAGIIGDYSCCSFLSPGTGTYKPGSTSNPYHGKHGEFSAVDELRIEVLVAEKDLDSVIKNLRHHHPYETMAYDVYPLVSNEKSQGLGRVGVLEKPLSLLEFAEHVKKCLGLKNIKIAGIKDLLIKKVALCTGSGSSMMKDFYRSGADVYLSGDMHYHDARDVEDAGLGLVDIGHFSSEIIMLKALEKKLKTACVDRGFIVDVAACFIEQDPFVLL